MTTLQLFALVLLWIVIIAEGILIFLLYRHVGLVYVRQHRGLPAGTQAPVISARDITGRTLSSKELLTKDRNLLIFGSFSCKLCGALLTAPEVGPFLNMHSVPGYFITRSSDLGNSQDLAKRLSHSNPSLEILGVDKRLFDAYLISSTPFAYILNRSGIVMAGGPVTELQDLVALFDRADKFIDGQSTQADHQVATSSILREALK